MTCLTQIIYTKCLAFINTNSAKLGTTESRYAGSAEKFFDRWYQWACRCRLEPVKKVARMIKHRLGNILSWFRHPISNGPAEGFNSRIQSIKSAARGFRNFENYRTRILFFCGKLELFPKDSH